MSQSPESGAPRPRQGAEPLRSPEQGLPDHHNPFGGIGGAAPARSALSLRLALAAFGLVLSLAGAITLWFAHVPLVFVVLLALIAATAVIDIVVVVRRKRRGEP